MVNWIVNGKLRYVDKEKIQALINQQRKNLAEVDYLDLNSAAKIVKKIEDPQIPSRDNSYKTDSENGKNGNATVSDVRFSSEEERSREGGNEEVNAGEWYDRGGVERIGEFAGYTPKQIAVAT